MFVTRLQGYAPGTVGRVGSIVLTKWGESSWSASASRQAESVFGRTALEALRKGLIRPAAAPFSIEAPAAS